MSADITIASEVGTLRQNYLHLIISRAFYAGAWQSILASAISEKRYYRACFE